MTWFQTLGLVLDLVQAAGLLAWLITECRSRRAGK